MLRRARCLLLKNAFSRHLGNKVRRVSSVFEDVIPEGTEDYDEYAPDWRFPYPGQFRRARLHRLRGNAPAGRCLPTSGSIKHQKS